MIATRVGCTVAVLALALGASGCPSRAGDANDLAVSSAAEARRVMIEALAELADGHIEATVARFCDQSDDGIVRARALVQPGVFRRDLVVRRVEPAWVGTDPYFYVEVGDAAAAAWVHGFGVDVRSGCLERAVGAPPARVLAPAVDDAPAPRVDEPGHGSVTP